MGGIDDLLTNPGGWGAAPTLATVSAPAPAPAAPAPPPGRGPTIAELVTTWANVQGAKAKAAALAQASGAAPAPGDPGFAASMLGNAPSRGPSPPPPPARPAGPAPGEPGFGLATLPPMPEAPPAPFPQRAPTMNVPEGAGTIDTSMVAPKGFASGAIAMPNVPRGAASVDMSGARPATGPLGNRYAGGENGPAPAGQPGVNWNFGGGSSQTIAAHEAPVVSSARQTQLTDAIRAEGQAVEGQKTAVAEGAEASADLEEAKAQGLRDQAIAAKAAADAAHLRTEMAKEDAKQFRAHIDDFSAKLAEDKIDPNRMYKNAGVGQNIVWALASALGAVQQGELHLSSNQIADHIQNMAAQDIAAQRADHETGRERVNDMRTAYAQALAATGDAEQAERLATGYALEAAKQNAQALAESASSKVQKAKGKEVVAALGERQAQIGQREAEAGIKMNPYVQARTVSTGVDIKAIGKMADHYIEEQAKLGHVVTPDEGFRYAIKMTTGRDPLPSAGAFSQGAKVEKGGTQETQRATDEFNRQMDQLSKHPVITGAGLTDAALSHLPQRMAPGSNDAKQQLEAINTQMLQAVGKVAKDADGKPNKAMIEKIEQRFELHLSDTPEIRQQKLRGVRDVYNALAREEGAKAPEPNAGLPSSFK